MRPDRDGPSRKRREKWTVYELESDEVISLMNATAKVTKADPFEHGKRRPGPAPGRRRPVDQRQRRQYSDEPPF
jgi:hypothetical protein